MDSDLADSIAVLKESFATRGCAARFGKAPQELVNHLRAKLRLPRRYREWLLAADPIDVETVTPAERVRLVPAADLEDEQLGFALNEDRAPILQPTASGWRAEWIIIGHSALLGDPYFLDTARGDAEGDCAVYTAMSGTDCWKPRLCASNFALFLRVLAVTMEVARGFADEDFDFDDEHVFREALGPKIREWDPAAAKAGHWT